MAMLGIFLLATRRSMPSVEALSTAYIQRPVRWNLSSQSTHAHKCSVRTCEILLNRNLLWTLASGSTCKYPFASLIKVDTIFPLLDTPRSMLKPLLRYAFDVLGELFYGSKFGFMQQRTDVGNYIKSIRSLLPAFSIGGTVPSDLTKLYLVSTILFSLSVRGALGAVKQLEPVSETTVKKRKQEIETKTDDKHDILRKTLKINADRGEKIDLTISHIIVESHSSL